MKDVRNDEMRRGAVLSLDPLVSEWGNPLRVKLQYRLVNKIAISKVS